MDNIYYNNSPNTWDYQWTLSSFLNEGITVVPNKNLIDNIGFDEDATHTFGNFSNNLIEKGQDKSFSLFPTIHPDYFQINKKADEIIDILEYSGGNKFSKIFIIKKLNNMKIKLLKLIKKLNFKK